MNEKQEKALVIAAQGFAVGVGALGIGFGLKWTLPALASMIGIATKIIKGGVVISAAYAWVIPAAGVGLAAVGATSVVFLGVKYIKQAKEKPYEWAMPVLAILSGAVIDTCKELFSEDSFIRIIYATVVALQFLLASVLWDQTKIKSISLKVVAILLFLASPFLIYLKHAQKAQKSLFEAYHDIPSNYVASIMLLLGLFSIMMFLSWYFKSEKS